ncbi:unnamed protein product [Caenorhabditis bovis]|uniref:Uncharacterized protein n=1 Tax=Caenorhabditis bovis TaxID=2654633 RepID=A0A8S1F2G6_9PELO|nr:unnamed protein product [Caenorhabditis bovis]
MEETPLKRRRATILVTGPHSKTKIFNDDDINSTAQHANTQFIPRNDLVVASTANSIEVLLQILMDEFELVRHNIREKGERMRNYVGRHVGFERFRQLLARVFAKFSGAKKCSRNILEFENDAELILNEVSNVTTWKPPRYTLNDIEEVLTTDDLEDGIIQRRSEKWECLPVRVKPEPAEDSFCEFQRLNVPMGMTYADDDEDRLSMPSTRTIMTTEDQMAAIQNQLAMLSKQLMSLQKTSTGKGGRSSRASSHRGGRRMEKKSSVEIVSSSDSSDESEDEGKGPSLCSPSHSLQRRNSPPSQTVSISSSGDLPPVAAPTSIPPPPPPPPVLKQITINNSENQASIKPKPLSKDPLPNIDTVSSNRPYLTDIANGRSLLKKTARSPGGSPMSHVRLKRPVTSFEAALRDRFRGFHGDNSFSEQEETEEDASETWD